jgi:hypothetical protein
MDKVRAKEAAQGEEEEGYGTQLARRSAGSPGGSLPPRGIGEEDPQGAVTDVVAPPVSDQTHYQSAHQRWKADECVPPHSDSTHGRKRCEGERLSGCPMGPGSRRQELKFGCCAREMKWGDGPN